MTNPGANPRLLLLGGLAAAALLLALLLFGGGGRVLSPVPSEATMQGIDRTVKELLAAYGVPEGSVRTRTVKAGQGGFRRVERRATVPWDFVTVQFNRDLNDRLGPFDGRSFATERTRENTVSVHVLAAHTVVQTVLFQLDPSVRRDTSAAVRRPAGE